MHAANGMSNGSGPHAAVGMLNGGGPHAAAAASLPMPLQDISKNSNALPVAATAGAVKRKREEEDSRMIETLMRDPEVKPVEGLSKPSERLLSSERGTVVSGGV
jgi:hypothetical protein